MKKQKKFTLVLLCIYLIVLTWIILLKMEFDFSLLGQMNLRSINLIPFAGSVIVNGQVDTSEIILNVVAFVPFGIYLSMLQEEWSFGRKLIPIFCVSFGFEILQFIFGIGASDITDLIGNTLGGAIGIAIFGLLSIVFKEKTIPIFNTLALIGTFFMVALLSLLTIVNM
ncbi:VanZ family protein [Paenibacillus sp. EC2-1]|uniref:VanZ family protein n=1 Tax=Paenibacillus sp. EC2-1 TaxID=3388665 RepID=UPI003BEEFC93